jgi:hypothetical protein
MAGPASARAGHLRLSLGRIRPRGIRAGGRLTQAREVQNHEGSVNQDRRRYSHHGEPRRARQAPRSLVVISGTHEAPVSHPEDEGWSPLGRPAGVLNFTLRLFGKQVEAIPCAQAESASGRWGPGNGYYLPPYPKLCRRVMIRCLTSFGLRMCSKTSWTLRGVRLCPNVCKRSSNGRFG